MSCVVLGFANEPLVARRPIRSLILCSLLCSNNSTALNQSRLQVLRVQEENLKNIFDAATQKIKDVKKDKKKWQGVLEGLILEVRLMDWVAHYVKKHVVAHVLICSGKPIGHVDAHVGASSNTTSTLGQGACSKGWRCRYQKVQGYFRKGVQVGLQG